MAVSDSMRTLARNAADTSASVIREFAHASPAAHVPNVPNRGSQRARNTQGREHAHEALAAAAQQLAAVASETTSPNGSVAGYAADAAAGGRV